MPNGQSWYKLYYHFVWGTKYRKPSLVPPLAPEMCRFIGAKCEELGYRLHAINTMPNHMHLLIELRPDQLVADVAKMLKGGSSFHINRAFPEDRGFRWQDGYGVVSIRESDVPTVRAYIDNQQTRHAEKQLIAALEKSAV
jgi:putative transposase